MTEPVKKDDDKKAKTLPVKLLAIAIGAIVVWVFFMFIPIPITGTVTAAGQGVRDTGIALQQFGASEMVFAEGLDEAAEGFRSTAKSFIKWLLTILVLGWIVSIMFSFRPKAKADDHAHHPHADKPADKKADAKSDDKAKT